MLAPLIRTATSLPSQPPALSAPTARSRAVSLAAGATESSRSSITSSAASSRALARNRSLLAGTDMQVRRGR